MRQNGEYISPIYNDNLTRQNVTITSMYSLTRYPPNTVSGTGLKFATKK